MITETRLLYSLTRIYFSQDTREMIGTRKTTRVRYIMSNIVLVCCSDDLAVPVDIDSIKDTCPPVLARFLGIGGGFTDPPKDEQGRLTFAKTFGISQYQFALIMAFVISGHVQELDTLVRNFTILGGSDALYALAEKQQKKKEEKEQRLFLEAERARANPLCPEENVLGLFKFEAHQSNWPHSGEWECCSRVKDSNIDYWWRKPVLQVLDVDESMMLDSLLDEEDPMDHS